MIKGCKTTFAAGEMQQEIDFQEAWKWFNGLPAALAVFTVLLSLTIWRVTRPETIKALSALLSTWRRDSVYIRQEKAKLQKQIEGVKAKRKNVPAKVPAKTKARKP